MNTFKILIVDDQESDISRLMESLEHPSVTFVSATSGVEALSILASSPDIELALVDTQMPGMNGFELAARMRNVDQTKHIPIMFLTENMTSNVYEFKVYEVAATDILSKPVNMEILKSKIDVFKKLREKRLAVDEKVVMLEKVTQDLVEARKIAEEADQAKSAFLANMSHEIRTPMSSILGFADLIKSSRLEPEKVSSFIEIIIRNGKHLLDIINDVLDLSKVEAGQLNVDIVNVNLKKLIEEVVLFLSSVAEYNNVTLNIGKCFKEDIVIKADSTRLKQVLMNLIGNSIKFSKGGTVLIDCQIAETTIDIVIEDNGIGIPIEKQRQLFIPFSQLTDCNSELTMRGTGLGLCLSKKLMQNMNGDILLARSAPNEGATFLVRTLLGDSHIAEFSPIQTWTPIEKECLKDRKIFVVDDSKDNQMLLQIMLEKYGATIDFAEDGQQAVEQLNNKQFDIVLMDYKMPIMDGFKATQNIRLSGNSVPIILLTANAMKGEREKSLQAGADAYISKPIDWSALLQSILSLVEPNVKNAEATL